MSDGDMDLVLVPEDFIAQLNASLEEGLGALRRLEARHGCPYRLVLKLNRAGCVQVHCEPAEASRRKEAVT